MDQRVNLITLIVADLDRSRAFYVQGLGWDPALDVAGEVIMFHVGAKLVLSLWAESAARSEIGPVSRAGTAPLTLAHNCASEAEVDSVLADAERCGATVSPGQQREWGGYSGYFIDPEGFRWEVAYNPVPIGDVLLP